MGHKPEIQCKFIDKNVKNQSSVVRIEVFEKTPGRIDWGAHRIVSNSNDILVLVQANVDHLSLILSLSYHLP